MTLSLGPLKPLMTSRSGIFTAGKRQNYAVGQRRNFSFCRGREMQPKPQEVVVSRIKVKLFVLIRANSWLGVQDVAMN